jgi:hypothetical protein
MLELPEKAHDLTFLSLENLARLAQSVGYERDMAREAFAVWHAARNQCVPFDDVVPSLRSSSRATGWRRSPTAMRISTRSASRHHFEVSLHAGRSDAPSQDLRAYGALARR